ncbi:acyl carrier protein-like protein [Xylariaceae sp. FL0804]|nr:acyl carrier protein-like protein [Xylariaceae sp. FL0804]
MFRTSAMRAASRGIAAASRPTTSTAAAFATVFPSARVAAAAAAAAAPTPRFAAAAAAVPLVRMYSDVPAGVKEVKWEDLTKEQQQSVLKRGAIEERIVGILKGFDKVANPEEIKDDSHFANDLGLDSLDTVEVVMAIEEEFSIEIPDKDADAIHSVDQAVNYILTQPDAH